MTQSFPILEFDPSYDTALDPAQILTRHAHMRAGVVMTSLQDTMQTAINNVLNMGFIVLILHLLV